MTKLLLYKMKDLKKVLTKKIKTWYDSPTHNNNSSVLLKCFGLLLSENFFKEIVIL